MEPSVYGSTIINAICSIGLGIRNKPRPDEPPSRTRFLFPLIADTGLSGRARLRNVRVDGGTAHCIAVAANTSKSDMKLPPQEKVDKLMGLLGTNEPPKCYVYDGYKQSLGRGTIRVSPYH